MDTKLKMECLATVHSMFHISLDIYHLFCLKLFIVFVNYEQMYQQMQDAISSYCQPGVYFRCREQKIVNPCSYCGQSQTVCPSINTLVLFYLNSKMNRLSVCGETIKRCNCHGLKIRVFYFFLYF